MSGAASLRACLRATRTLTPMASMAATTTRATTRATIHCTSAARISIRTVAPLGVVWKARMTCSSVRSGPPTNRRPRWSRTTIRASRLTSPPIHGASIASSSSSPLEMRRSTERAREEVRSSSVDRSASQIMRPPKMARGTPRRRTATVTATSVIVTARRRTVASALCGRLEPEAHAPDGGDVAGVVGVVAELAPQPRHVHVEGLGRAGGVRAPHLAHEGVARNDGTGLPHQHPEQLELLGGEVELAAALEGAVGGDVDADVLRGDLVLVGELPAGPAQQCADAGEQLSEPEGFGHVVVGAGVQADDEVHLVRPCGEHEDRCGHPLAADPARDVEAVHVGQPEVEHDEVRVAGVVDRPLSGAEGTHVVALTRQRAGERLGDRRALLDEEHGCDAPAVTGSAGTRVAGTPASSAAVVVVPPTRRRTPRVSVPLPSQSPSSTSSPRRPKVTTWSAWPPRRELATWNVRPRCTIRVSRPSPSQSPAWVMSSPRP